jgi:hypothetical protein
VTFRVLECVILLDWEYCRDFDLVAELDFERLRGRERECEGVIVTEGVTVQVKMRCEIPKSTPSTPSDCQVAMS